MTRATIAGGILLVTAVALVLVVLDRAPGKNVASGPAPSASTAPEEDHPGFLYGRVVADGTTYQGRLRWGGDQEAWWGDYFDGTRINNRWAVHAPGHGEQWRVFGVTIGGGSPDLVRPFIARFGDIARIEAHYRIVQVTLKSGTMFELDRSSPGDIDDGVRVWDGRHGVVDIDSADIDTIEFIPTAPLVAAPARLHGTVQTRQGTFTGFVEWNRQDSVGTDALTARVNGREHGVAYDDIRAVARQPGGGALVTLRDGREMLLADGPDIGRDQRGIYVDDGRYGRVLISWDAFEGIEFSPSDSGPGYGDFLPGQPLAGIVTTRDSRRLSGRLVYDLDESETTETLDFENGGVDYFVPFGSIASIGLRGSDGRGGVILRDGRELLVARNGDLGNQNAGLLIFVEGRARPEYVPWTDVERIDFARGQRDPVPDP